MGRPREARSAPRLGANAGEEGGCPAPRNSSMSTHAISEQYRDLRLTPYQAELVAKVADSSMPARHLLIARPGMGKTVAAISLVATIAKREPSSRILIVAPRSLI